MTIDEKLKIANNILNIIGITLKVRKPEDINVKLFVIFYRKLFNDQLEGIIETANSDKDNFDNISLIIESLSKDILHVSLSHIKPGDIVRGSDSAIINLLEIFQGLAKCVVKQENKPSDKARSNPVTHGRVHGHARVRLAEDGALNNADMHYSQLRQRMRDTERQVDNLATLAGQVSGVGSTRQRYLHDKMKALLSKLGSAGYGFATSLVAGDNCPDTPADSDNRGRTRRSQLQEYVDDHKDQLLLIQDKLLNGRSAVDTRMPHGRGDDLQQYQQVNCGLTQEDDLTNVTTNDLGGVARFDKFADHNLDDISCASNETYVLESPTGSCSDRMDKEDDRVDEKSLMADVLVKDAWAQVNKNLIQQKYEQEFLDMLLEEGEALNDERYKCERQSDVLRNISKLNATARPLSAFDEILQDQASSGRGTSRVSSSSARYTGGRGSGSNSSRHRMISPHHDKRSATTDKGGFMRPIVKHLGAHRYRQCPEPIAGDDLSWHQSSSNSGIDRDMMVMRLLDEFPGLQLSEHTIRNLWTHAARQAASIESAQRHFISKLMPGEKRVEEARRRQEMLSMMLRKEAKHQMRLQERREERQVHLATHSSKEKQRQQSARAKRYVDEFSSKMRARMMHKQAREEQVFRTMFKAALKLQRDRINEMRRYVRDVKNEHLLFHQKDLNSLENYYRDRFSMLAESLRNERKQLHLQDKSQELALVRLKREMRTKLENDIRNIQESMVQSQHEVYFRELDAQKVLSTVSRE